MLVIWLAGHSSDEAKMLIDLHQGYVREDC